MTTKKIHPYTPHLKRVLISYQSSAKDSLHGPSVILGDQDYDLTKVKTEVGDNPATPPEFKELIIGPPVPPPIFSARDPGSTSLLEVSLHGHTLHGFMVGGEARLCLVEVFNTVLSDIHIADINVAWDLLQLHRSSCSPAQLEAFKAAGVLPSHTADAGLVTKTDAERLCNALVYNNFLPNAKRLKLENNGYVSFSMRVYHECFGKCEGLCTPDLYISSSSSCIECLECHNMFSPENFVKHAHKDRERRTCHWGFDSANWRAYLLLAKDQVNHESLVKVLDEFKLRFVNDENALDLGVKQDPERYAPQKPSPSIPIVDAWGSSAGSPPPAHIGYWLNKAEKVAPATLTAEPPTLKSLDSPPALVNPEKVISRNDAEKFELHYQPNVALAPKPSRELSTVLNLKQEKVDTVGTSSTNCEY
ncbi:ski oncogene-like [Artemia franciscana]|uniref:ski oncogene-like n=1 Tax=Artemia franciscana TaxID=6661 RepID=UPI0032DA1041